MRGFEKIYEEKTDRIESALAVYLRPRYPERLYEAMAYSVSAGGKRLRPVLLLVSAALFGGVEEEALPFACAIEMIHTYSLIHDDLPAMDDDSFRRGKPTNHRVFGEAMAILAGDGLLNMAYEVMGAFCEANPCPGNFSAMRLLAQAAGAEGMVGGQAADILNENKTVNLDTLRYIHSHKTGALIRAALLAGAVQAGAAADDQRMIGVIGEKLGLAFQIRDDILDITGSLATLGKETNADARKNKTTYVSFFGLERAKADYAALCDEIAATLALLPGDTAFLLWLTKWLTERNR